MEELIIFGMRTCFKINFIFCLYFTPNQYCCQKNAVMVRVHFAKLKFRSSTKMRKNERISIIAKYSTGIYIKKQPPELTQFFALLKDLVAGDNILPNLRFPPLRILKRYSFYGGGPHSMWGPRCCYFRPTVSIEKSLNSEAIQDSNSLSSV